MGYANFIPTIWSEAIQRELELNRVFVGDCNRQFEGEIKKKGDQVRILGVGKPTIHTIASDARNDDIEGPEEIADNSTTLIVDQIRYFNYMVGDIDKAQSIGGLMDALSKESAEALANEEDKYIAKMVLEAGKVYEANQAINEGNVLDVIDKAVEKLYENNVSPSTKLVLTVSPRFNTLFRKAYLGRDTDNSEIMKNGIVGKYNNVTIKLSNSVHKDGTVDHLMIRTQRAIAFAQQLTEIEAYRPEKKFADAVKGLSLFGAKIVRPKEIFDLNVSY